MGDQEEQGWDDRCEVAGCCDTPRVTFEEAVALARELAKRTA